MRSVLDVKVLFLRDWPGKSESTKLEMRFFGTTATKDDWSAGRNSFMYFGLRVKRWYSWWLWPKLSQQEVIWAICPFVNRAFIVWAINCLFCRDLNFTLTIFGLLQEDLFKGRWCLAEGFFKQNYCHSYHTRFDVFFLLPSCCVSSLIIITLRHST